MTNAINFDNRDIARYLPGERRMPMRGFDPTYTDIVDYIIRITHRIWEEKAIGYIYETYQHNCVIHGSGGDVQGREAVVASTLQSQAAFPDLHGYGDEVVWAGNEDDGFHTSHLVNSVGHNTGYTAYGPPTGRKIMGRAIANCLARNNMIFEEWVLRDETAVIRQLGYDVHEIVDRQVRVALAHGGVIEPLGEIGRTIGQLPPAALTQRSDGPFDIEDFVRSTLHAVWNWRLLNVIRERYAPNHVCYTNGRRKLQGHAELSAWMLNLLAMFPDAGVGIDHLYWNGDDANGYRVAVRWTFAGTHTGYGVFGPPSGAYVRVMVLSQHQIKDGKFAQEHILLDEMEMLRRIATQRLLAV